MKEELRRFHLDVITEHNHKLRTTLIYPEHIISVNMKRAEFNEEPGCFHEGYYARKNNTLYWLDGTYPIEGNKEAKIIEVLPIRINGTEQVSELKNVAKRVQNITPFRITPENTWKGKTREFFDSFLPFAHSNPKGFFTVKMISLMADIGKTFTCIATPSSFAKTSVFKVMDGITGRTPVFKPRTIPAAMNALNGRGNVVYDEVMNSKKEVKEIIEEITLTVADGSPNYKNGAKKTSGTKEMYDTSYQSFTYLYNIAENYKDAESSYFDFSFYNNKAMDDRLLKFRFDGELEEKFDKRFNIQEEAEKNKMFYINYAKMMEFLAVVKKRNLYKRKFKTNSVVMDNLSNRKFQTYEDITYGLDVYCKTQEEYNTFIAVLDNGILDYQAMINKLKKRRINV